MFFCFALLAFIVCTFLGINVANNSTHQLLHIARRNGTLLAECISHEREIFVDLTLMCLSVKFCWFDDVERPQSAGESITSLRTFSEVNLRCKFRRVSDNKRLCILILFLVIVFFFPVVIILTPSLQNNSLHATGLTFTGACFDYLWYTDLTVWSLWTADFQLVSEIFTF